ncbi:MAG: hypothetical protein JWO06_2 [Bacteroidota bacterium]|nr:hypothetical protein [Bacteroidota bacterium]
MLTYLLVCLSSALFAGTGKDTVMLNEVVKVERASTDVQAFESPFTDLKYKQGERLSDALGEYSSVYVKNYGSGGLASLAIRGTSATQSEIQWNGVKLNSPSLGQVDLSLFLLGAQDELQLVRTGYKGTIGGTLNMANNLIRDSGFSIGGTVRVASFNTYEVAADAQYANQRFSGTTKFGYLSSENDFLYRNSFQEGSPYVRQTNAAVHQLSFLQQFGAKINERNDVTFFLWLTDAQRQLPPVMSQLSGKESQDDNSMRAMANWNGRFKKLKLKFSSAWLYDWMRYKDPNAFIDDIAITQALRNTFSFSYLLPFNLAINSEVNYDHEIANINAYSSVKSRDIVGLKAYADYYLLNKIRFHGGFREDLVDKKLSAFAPELAVNYATKLSGGNGISTGLIASRNFRFPTLNDMYWTPGGNPNLKEEKSWNGEIQAKYSYQKMINVSLSNFYIYVDNWIQWIPQGAIWMPVNFRRVFSRGAEASFHVTNAEEGYPNRFIVHFNASYTYTKTTNLDAASQFDQSKGMQLIYVPYHNAVLGLQLQYRKFYLRSTNSFTGPVFTSTDNTQMLNGYFITNLEAGKDFSFKHTEVGFSFRVNNLGNTQYQVVAQRPMPGRNFEGTLRFKFFS